METNNKKTIKSFTDLNAWREGHRLVLNIYKVIKSFPSNERFGLSNQLSRAAVSITSNIAEGFTRRTAKEKIQFYRMALGSLTEIQNQLLIAKDTGLIDIITFKKIAEHSVTVSKLLAGLIKSAKSLD